MSKTRIEKLLSRYLSGMLTAAEIANAMLVDLVSDDCFNRNFVHILAELPDEVQTKLLDLINNIRLANHCWKPFQFGPSEDVDTWNVDPARLQRISEELALHRRFIENQ